MKKSFFKKLSFILALAMIVSLIAPAAGAFAASSPALSIAKKYLFVGEEGRNEYDFNIKNKPAGAKYVWSSADEKVAIVDDANGLTTAVGVGTTKVTVVISKKGSKDVKLSATVVVKDNIKTVTVSNKPEKALAIGAEFDFNRTFTTFGGSTTKTTSVTRWIVDKADKATISDAGVFKATEAGTYKVTALSFQSADKYNAWKALNDPASTVGVLDTDTVEVTVAASMKAVQKDLDTVVVTFDSAMTDVAKNISFYTLVGNTEVKVTTVKAVSMDANKKVATVDFYTNLTDEATYVVKYTGVETVKFTAAKAAFDKVAKVVVNTTEAVLNEATAIDYSLLDANGVDITNGTGLKDRVTFKSSSNRVFYDPSNKKVVFFTKGDTTTVEATFHTYKWDTTGTEIGNLTATGTIVGVDAPSLTVSTVKAWTILDNTVTSPSYSDVKQKLAASDTGKKLFVQLNTMKSGTAGTVESSAAAEVSKFKYTSSDPTVVMIDNSGNLYPVKAGAVTIVVKYNDTAVDVINLTVAGERKATDMTLGKTEISLSSSSAVGDFADVSVKVIDQLGDEVAISSSDISIKALDGSADKTLASVVPGAKTVRFVGAGKTKGISTYEIKAKDIARYVTVTVVDPTSATPSGYMLSLSTLDADSKSTTDDATPSITIDLFGIAGTKTSHPAITGAGFTVEITKPNGTLWGTLSSNTFELTTLSGSAISKIDNGTYTVTAKNLSGVAVDIKYFTVKDSQLKPVLDSVKDATYTAGKALNDIAHDCFKVTFDGAEKTDFVMGDNVVTADGQIYVKNLKWTQTITDKNGTYTLTHTIDVYQYLYKK